MLTAVPPTESWLEVELEGERGWLCGPVVTIGRGSHTMSHLCVSMDLGVSQRALVLESRSGTWLTGSPPRELRAGEVLTVAGQAVKLLALCAATGTLVAPASTEELLVMLDGDRIWLEANSRASVPSRRTASRGLPAAGYLEMALVKMQRDGVLIARLQPGDLGVSPGHFKNLKAFSMEIETTLNVALGQLSLHPGKVEFSPAEITVDVRPACRRVRVTTPARRSSG